MLLPSHFCVKFHWDLFCSFCVIEPQNQLILYRWFVDCLTYLFKSLRLHWSWKHTYCINNIIYFTVKRLNGGDYWTNFQDMCVYWREYADLPNFVCVLYLSSNLEVLNLKFWIINIINILNKLRKGRLLADYDPCTPHSSRKHLSE